MVTSLECLRREDDTSLYAHVSLACHAYARAFAAQSDVIMRTTKTHRASASPTADALTVDTRDMFILEACSPPAPSFSQGIASLLFACDDVSGALEAITTMRTPNDAERILYYEVPYTPGLL